MIEDPASPPDICSWLSLSASEASTGASRENVDVPRRMPMPTALMPLADAITKGCPWSSCKSSKQSFTFLRFRDQPFRPTFVCTGLQVNDLLNAPLQMKLSGAITFRFLKRLTVFTYISTYIHTYLSGPLWASLGLSGPLCASLRLCEALWVSLDLSGSTSEAPTQIHTRILWFLKYIDRMQRRGALVALHKGAQECCRHGSRPTFASRRTYLHSYIHDIHT